MKVFELKEVDSPDADYIDVWRNVVETIATVVSHASCRLYHPEDLPIPAPKTWDVECHPDGGPTVYLSIRADAGNITLYATTKR